MTAVTLHRLSYLLQLLYNLCDAKYSKYPYLLDELVLQNTHLTLVPYFTTYAVSILHRERFQSLISVYPE